MHTGKIYTPAEIEQSEKLSKVARYSDIASKEMTADEHGCCNEWHQQINNRTISFADKRLLPSTELEAAIQVYNKSINGDIEIQESLTIFKQTLFNEIIKALENQCGENKELKTQITPELIEFIYRKTFQSGIAFKGLDELCQILTNTNPISGIDQIRVAYNFSVNNTSTDKLQIKLNVRAICRQKFIQFELINSQQAINALLNTLGNHGLQSSLENAENLASPIKEKVIECLKQQPPQFEAALAIIESEFEKIPVVLCDSTYNISFDDDNKPQATTSDFSYNISSSKEDNQTAILAYCEDKMRRLMLEKNIHSNYAIHLIAKTLNLLTKSDEEISPDLADLIKSLSQKAGLQSADHLRFEPKALLWLFNQSSNLFTLTFLESLLNFYAQKDNFVDVTIKQLINNIITKLNLNPLEHKTTLDFARAVLNKDGEFIVHHRINNIYSDNAQMADIHRYKIQITHENAPAESGPINYTDAESLKRDLLDNNVSSNITDYLLSRLNQFGLLKLFNELEPKLVQTATSSEVDKYARTLSYLKIIVKADNSVTLVLNMQRKDEMSKRLYEITTSIDISDKMPPKTTLRAHDYKNFAPNEFHLHENFKQTATLKLLPKLQNNLPLSGYEQEIITQALLPHTRLSNNKVTLTKITDRKMALLLAIHDPNCLGKLSEENFPIFFESCFTYIAQSQGNKHPHIVKFINDNFNKYTHLLTMSPQKGKRPTKQFAEYLAKILDVANKQQNTPLTDTIIDDLFERVYADPEQLSEEDSKTLNQLVVPFVQLQEGRVYFAGWPQNVLSENPKARILAMYKIAVLANLGELKAQNYLSNIFKNKNEKIELNSLLEPHRLIAAMANNHLITLKDCYTLNPIKDQGEWDRRVTRVALRPENKVLMPELKSILKDENEKMATLQTIGKPGNILQTFIDWTVKIISFAYETDRYKELVERQQATELFAPIQPNTKTISVNNGLQDMGKYLVNLAHKRRPSAEKAVSEMAEIQRVADSSTVYAEQRAKARNAELQKTSTPKSIDLGKQNTPVISS